LKTYSVRGYLGEYVTKIWWPGSAITLRTDGPKLAQKNYGFGHISVKKIRKNAKVGNLIKLVWTVRLRHKTAYLAKRTTF